MTKKADKKISAEVLDEARSLEAELFGAPADGSDNGLGDLVGSFFEDRDGEGDGQDEDAGRAAPGEGRGRAAGPSGRDAAAGAAGRKRRQPAWQDEGDEGMAVNIAQKKTLRKLRKAEDEKALTTADYEERLRAQHRKLNPGASDWAAPWRRRGRAAAEGAGAGSEGEEEEEEGSDEEDGAAGRLAKSVALTARRARGAPLPQTLLEASRVRDANQHDPSKAVVQSVRFHPTRGDVLLTAGLDKKLRLFQVDGVRNPRLQAVHFDDAPLTTAEWALGGSHVALSGRRKFWYLYDVNKGAIERVHGPFGREEKSLEDFVVQSDASVSDPLIAFLGNEGCVPLVSVKSRQSVGVLKMSGSVRCASFGADGLSLYTMGSDGIVHLWDVRQRRCVGRAADQGATKATALATSTNGGWLATGSEAGVVNLYRSDKLFPPAPQPLAGRFAPAPLPAANPEPERAILSLTTLSDTLRFSPDGQMLGIASRMKRDAMRIVHLPSGTVFQNWPTSRTPLGHVHSMDFSPNCGFVAVGNAKGKVLLYRLHHYQSA